MQHYAAFHVHLHCLQKYSFRGFLNTKGLLCKGIFVVVVEPVKQRKKKERRFVNLDENTSHRPQTRGSSRMNQQVPLDVMAPVKMEAEVT